MRTLIAFLLAGIAAVAFAQGAYRWIGKDGRVHYSDDPPPSDAQKIEQKRLDPSIVSGGDKYGYETRRAASSFPVTLYVSPDCGNACDVARSHLVKRGIPYAEKRVATAEDIAAFKQATQSEITPTLLVGKMVSKGFQEAAWDGLLDTAGYPAGK